jgi:uncharacterized protein YggE
MPKQPYSVHLTSAPAQTVQAAMSRRISPADFWAMLASQEVQRKAREQQTRELKVRPQYKVAANDEPEPVVAKGEK